MVASDPTPPSLPGGLGETDFHVRGARAGNVADLERLYERTVPALYVWLRGRIGRSLRLDVEPEDVLQEVWSRALPAFDSFDPDRSSFRSWLIGIARNVLLESMRRASARALRKGTDSPSSIFARCPDSVTSVTRAVARDEDVLRFLELVGTLDEEDQTVLYGHGVEDEPLAAVATRLGISAEAAKKRWQRVIARLRAEGVGRDVLGERWG